MNTYLAFAIAASMGGPAAIEATAVAVAVFVPSANLLCVSILVRYASAEGASFRKALIAIAKNPLILSILFGIMLNLTGLGLPPVVDSMLSVLGDAALALGLIAVGAGLDLKALRNGGRLVVITTLLKLAVMPLIAFGLCQLLGVSGTSAFAVILLNAMPTAGAAYILARQLGGNATLMATLITVQTAAAMISLPVVLTLLT